MTIPRTVTNFPTESARTSRITRGLLLLGPWKYNSLEKKTFVSKVLENKSPTLPTKTLTIYASAQKDIGFEGSGLPQGLCSAAPSSTGAQCKHPGHLYSPPKADRKSERRIGKEYRGCGAGESETSNLPPSPCTQAEALVQHQQTALSSVWHSHKLSRPTQGHLQLHHLGPRTMPLVPDEPDAPEARNRQQCFSVTSHPYIPREERTQGRVRTS